MLVWGLLMTIHSDGPGGIYEAIRKVRQLIEREVFGAVNDQGKVEPYGDRILQEQYGDDLSDIHVRIHDLHADMGAIVDKYEAGEYHTAVKMADDGR